MTNNPLRRLSEHGQSIWLDNLTRGMLQSGALKRLIDEDGISGVTSNPAIFNKAMTKGTDYDAQIRALAEQGKTAGEIYEALAVKDIRDACDLFRPTFDGTNGTDGFVSLEVSPHLARDTRGTAAEARRLWAKVDRPNVLIKIPGTPEGVPAIQECLTAGVNINITLLFSLEAYQNVMEAHLQALEARAKAGEPLASVASVASFFLSRIDTLVDEQLDAMKEKGEHAREAAALRGKAAIASARIAYQMWKTTYEGPRWEALLEAGGRVQKPLWASTSTKDPSYPDVLYVEALIGPHTVNTLPDSTVEAFRNHGTVKVTVENAVQEQDEVLQRLETIGISMKSVTDTLVEEGIVKFSEPFDALMADLDAKRKSLIPSGT
jgi:transaldolase